MKTKFTDEYKSFYRKTMLRICGALVGAVGIVLAFYWLVWRERMGNWIVFLMKSLGMEEGEAFWAYHSFFRQNKAVLFAAAAVVVFILLVRFLLIWMSHYFENINSGIDKLLEDNNERIQLLAEMEPMEAKLNLVRQTLWQRKQESILAEQRKNELVMYLAHDIRTPLTSVIGYLNFLEEAPDMPDEQKAKCVHISLEKAYRLEAMVNEFFDITRYNSGQIHLVKKQTDLYYMLVQVIDEHTPALTAHGNHVVLEAEENLTVFGDPEKLARVFNNLLKNAAAYSYPDTEMRVCAEETEGYMKITFENKGKTIPEEQLQTLFQKFHRLDEARESVTGGAGLGLAIAKEIVLLHGGTIEAESKEETVTFTVLLPRI